MKKNLRKFRKKIFKNYENSAGIPGFFEIFLEFFFAEKILKNCENSAKNYNYEIL